MSHTSFFVLQIPEDDSVKNQEKPPPTEEINAEQDELASENLGLSSVADSSCGLGSLQEPAAASTDEALASPGDTEGTTAPVDAPSENHEPVETPNKGKGKASKLQINKAQIKEMLDSGGMLHIIETYPKHAVKARAYMNKKVVRLSDVL